MSVTFKQTIIHFKMDLQRRLYLEDKSNTFLNGFFAFFHRGVISAFIYRINHYLHGKNNFLAKLCIRLLRYIEFHYCHIEIEPNAEIGPGLVLTDFGGIGISHLNVIGKNCTFLGKATPTLGAMEDVVVAVDRIRIGDNCVIGPNVRIVNNVNIANGVQIKANSVVLIAIENEGAVVSGFPAKEIYQVPMNDVMRWSPLLCKYVA
jgi:serine acetyltransferase